MAKRFLTVQEVATMTETSERTVRDWCAKGALPSTRTEGARAYRIPVDVLRERADMMGYAVSREDELSEY